MYPKTGVWGDGISPMSEPKRPSADDRPTTTDEIKRAIEALTTPQLVQLEQTAWFRHRSLGRRLAGRQARDLLFDAMIAALEGGGNGSRPTAISRGFLGVYCAAWRVTSDRESQSTLSMTSPCARAHARLLTVKAKSRSRQPTPARCPSTSSPTSCFTSVAAIDRRPRQCAKPKPRQWRSS
jgi:hypothetical protein